MFYLDKDRSVREWAFITHVWARIGYSPGKRRAVLRGVFLPNVDIRPWGYDAALRELRLSPFHLLPKVMDQYLRLISRYRVSFIHGYPSAIAILAGHALSASWSPPSSLEGILPISERLTVDQRELFRAAFGDVAVLSYYGLSEKAAFAGEIPGEPDVYEFEPLYGITELVDDEGRPIREPGEQGRVIGTGLLSRGMPLLRYDTEDRAELVRAPTHDNAYRLRVRGITSRWSEEYLVSKQGSLVSIAAINVHSRAYADVREFQFFQDTQGVAVLRVVPREGVCAEALARLANDFRTKVGSGLRIELEVVKAIDTNTRGKRLFVDQRLPISRLAANPPTLS
jgi:phenylacetate-CoA ligase